MHTFECLLSESTDSQFLHFRWKWKGTYSSFKECEFGEKIHKKGLQTFVFLVFIKKNAPHLKVCVVFHKMAQI